jgi:MoaA/NifB/PqqE/SkfB family radical SAM enzyme
MGHLYTKYKIFHYGEKLDSLPMQNPKVMPPLQVRIKPTNVCAHHCWYCAYRAEDLQLGKDMVIKDHIPREKMMEIVDDLIEMNVKSVTFSGGGDPFHYPYLLETVKKLSTSSVKFASLTHGGLLSGEIAEVFANHATWVRVSIDGWDDESYARYRGVKVGEFTKVMQNMQNFKKLGGACYLGVSLVVDKDNAEHIFDFVSRLKEIGVDSVKISACIVSNSAKENNEYHRVFFDVAKEQAMRAASELSDDKFEVYDSYHELEEKFDKPYHWCPYLQICPVIGADLNVYACHDKAYNLDNGVICSIKDKSFKEAWMSSKEQFFDIDPSVTCNNHCVVNEKNKMVLEYLDAEHLWFV